MTVPYSSPRPIPIGGLSNVALDFNTLANNDVVKYDSTTQLWRNAPDSASGGTANDIVVTDTNTDATYYPTFVDGAGVAQDLRCDATTRPWSINPNTGEFKFVDGIRIEGTGGLGSVDLGLSAGNSSVANNRVSVGAGSGQTLQNTNAVAIGSLAGNSNQSATGTGGAVAIGAGAGQTDQSSAGVGIGLNAANSRQGRNSIAIGANAATSTQPANQVCLNASGLAFTGINIGATYINTLRRLDNGSGAGNVTFDPVTFELTYSTT